MNFRKRTEKVHWQQCDMIHRDEFMNRDEKMSLSMKLPQILFLLFFLCRINVSITQVVYFYMVMFVPTLKPFSTKRLKNDGIMFSKFWKNI